MDFSTSNQSRNTDVHTLFLTLNTLKVATIHLQNGTLGKTTSTNMADFKPCGNFKVRLVVDEHLTKEPTEIDHSGIVSLRNFRLTMFIAEPNNFQLWGADDENAYLQCIVAGPEAEELQEHVLVMYKTLNGTRAGRAHWHDKASDIF